MNKDLPSRTTSPSSSSYSLREIIPEREPIPVIDLSDDKTSIEEDPSEPTSDSEMTPEPEQGTPAVTGSMGTSVANTMPAAASPTPIPPVASVSSFLASLLRGGVREYDICALERFLKFRPPEFYGDVEQEIKAELFLEQLNDIYDTLKYEDALRVTFAAFRLRGMAKDWWLRASEARILKNQPWTWNDFQEEFKKEYIPRWVRYLAYLLNKPKEEVKLDTVPVVREFVDVFPEELTTLPPDREVEFGIELVPDAKPISRTPYRMAQEELK
ncbi:hypothetical protein M9H77_31295 [Catharanthus roseus]|uniref:Uncharacterized protein n=1 Tax=Catharanthus roseus TaxID=4058 RepID=A0ACC0A208_CATRO|nr:hypothetical protein M9H77_31295 [Catharanthus roseus]